MDGAFTSEFYYSEFPPVLYFMQNGPAHVRFSDAHAFEKPNDIRALNLMDRAAQSVMQELGDVIMAFGESDECECLSS